MTGSATKTVVLIVEDEALLRLDFEESLLDAGYLVHTAANADDAIIILIAHSDINIVITDINMPGSMNGLGLMLVVKDRWPTVKLMIVSSHEFQAGDVSDDVPIFRKPLIFADLHAKAGQMMA